MTPKQKAKELFDKMCMNDGDEHHHCTYYVAKQCAIITVDEILEADWFIPTLKDKNEWTSYWQEVKQEIENI